MSSNQAQLQLSPHDASRSGLLRGVVTVLIAIVLWFLPVPAEIDAQAWHLFAIFLATVAGLILQPLPMGAMVLIAITVTMITRTLTFEKAMTGYTNPTVWLIVAAFLFARAFGKTGLGRRVAFIFIRTFGKRTLGLGYALAMTDLVLAPGIPSGAARTGGVLFPIVKSLASSYGSEPGPTSGRIGSFLMLSAYQTHAVTCSMFVTSMVANMMIVDLTRKTLGLEITWAGWATAAFVPGIISFLLMPYLVFRCIRPEIRETPEATDLARKELAKMGPVSRYERIVLGVFALTFVLWITGSVTAPYIQVETKFYPTIVAFVGLAVLLILGALKWEDVLAERSGWDALIWFGGLAGMAEMLSEPLKTWFSTYVGPQVQGLHLHWLPALVVLALLYLYAHYFFASLTAHTTALFVPFLLLAKATGAPPYLAALVFAFFSSLCASLTHYGGGPSPVYWGAGYLTIRQWWTVGFAASLMFIVVWLGIGPLWWKALGLF